MLGVYRSDHKSSTISESPSQCRPENMRVYLLSFILLRSVSIPLIHGSGPIGTFSLLVIAPSRDVRFDFDHPGL